MKITHIVVHYSATYADQDIGVKELDKMHKARGWKGVGYHYVIRRNGSIEKGRPDTEVGAHVANQNSGKLGICWIGGAERGSGPDVGVNNMTAAQTTALVGLIRQLLTKHPGATVVGHNDLAATQCPGFSVQSWWSQVQLPAEEQPVAPSWLDGLSVKAREKVVMEVQTALLQHGFVKVGGIDGQLGDNTRGAIRDFRAKNGLPPAVPPNYIDEELLAALKRPDAVRPVIDPDRANATVETLKQRGSVIAKSAGKQQRTVEVITGGVVATETANRLGILDSIGPVIAPVKEFGVEYGVWILMAVIVVMAGIVWYQARQVQQARLRDHRSGNTSMIDLPQYEEQ